MDEPEDGGKTIAVRVEDIQRLRELYLEWRENYPSAPASIDYYRVVKLH